jgi:hypothetical protein
VTIRGTLWMFHHYSDAWVEILVGKAEDAVWVKVAKNSDLHVESWLYLGKRVVAEVEDGILTGLLGVET